MWFLLKKPDLTKHITTVKSWVRFISNYRNNACRWEVAIKFTGAIIATPLSLNKLQSSLLCCPAIFNYRKLFLILSGKLLNLCYKEETDRDILRAIQTDRQTDLLQNHPLPCSSLKLYNTTKHAPRLKITIQTSFHAIINRLEPTKQPATSRHTWKQWT